MALRLRTIDRLSYTKLITGAYSLMTFGARHGITGRIPLF